MIYGESGTGKELVAKAIHFNSPRKDQKLVSINCGAIPENLLESELFGYVRGAFTGANVDKKGLFEAADGGTIFLDEVEAMSKSLQVKLLRVLQDRTFFKVGSAKPLTVDIRIIAATNQSIEEAVKAKEFREDLYYRLNVIRIELPSLSERPDDIPLIARYFVAKFNRKIGKNVRTISGEAMDALTNYSWPGNVRELENTLERAVAVSETGEIRREDLPIDVVMHLGESRKDLTLETMEKEHIMRVMGLVDGQKKKAAQMLGLDPATLWRKLKRIQS